MKPISQVPKSLEIIENVQKISGDVWVNKHQCKRVADRFAAIGKGLSDLNYCGDSDASSNMTYPAFDELLTVLRKGEVLVSKNIQLIGIKSVLTWTDNREAFKEIHEELDTMKAKFPFEGFSGHFETSSGIQRSEILAQDADKDLEEMKDLSNIEKSLQSSEKPEAMDLEKVVKVVLEKTEAKSEPQGDSDDLPSYLKIDLSTIEIKDPVRKQEILSKQESKETHGWAIVCEGTWLGCEFAVKVFKSDESDWNKNQLLKEVGALMELRHPHIIRFIGFAEDARLCSLLMEMMPERDLRHFMKQHMKQHPGRPFTRSQELDIITQIAKGMYYLHTQGYVHGDLKCSNILVKKYEDYIEVKIGDLRYAQKLESAGGSSEINLVRRPRWTPLEALDNYGGAKPTDDMLKQADVYSFAMTCYEVLSGKYPFDGVRDDALLAQIKEGVRPELPGDLDSRLKGLIKECWDSDPNKRPVFENICHVLDYIRSSMPAATTISSGIANVWNAFKKIPKIQEILNVWPRGVRSRVEAVESSIESSAKAATTTWAGNVAKESVTEGGAYADAIKIPECLKIKSESLKKVRRVGKGSFAKVYEATWLGCTFAVKRINKFDSAGSISVLQREVDFLIQLRHPYIIQIVGFSVDKEERCLIVMEYMDGSLRDLINNRMKRKVAVTKIDSSQPVLPFESHEAVCIIKKIALGMAFLHSRGITHRDLKCSNVLCQEYNGSMDVKIVDFGVSQYIATSGMDGVLGIGTGYWRAPEIFPSDVNRSRKCDVVLKATDVYSFGMTCYEVLTGETPFFKEFGMRLTEYDQVVKGRRPELPPDMDSGLNKLIAECWDTDPNLRPDFAEICARLDAFPH